jgi:hypothetical protein
VPPVGPVHAGRFDSGESVRITKHVSTLTGSRHAFAVAAALYITRRRKTRQVYARRANPEAASCTPNTRARAHTHKRKVALPTDTESTRAQPVAGSAVVVWCGVVTGGCLALARSTHDWELKPPPPPGQWPRRRGRGHDEPTTGRSGRESRAAGRPAMCHGAEPSRAVTGHVRSGRVWPAHPPGPSARRARSARRTAWATSEPTGAASDCPVGPAAVA